MTGGLGVARVIVLLFGVTMMLAGLATIAFGGAAAFITGLWVLGDRHRLHHRHAHRARPLPLRCDRPRRRCRPARRAASRSATAPRAALPAERRGLRRPDLGPSDARLAGPGERRTAVRRPRIERGGVLSSPAGPHTSCRPRCGGPTTPDGRDRTRRTRPSRGRPAPAPRAAARRSTFPYLNRELSWLEFNARVLHEARDERNPLLERVKFLAIFAGNLDEFFQVRVAGLRQQVEAGKVARSPDGRTADEQLAAARERVLGLVADHSAIFLSVRRALAAEGVELLDYAGDPGASRGAPPALPRRDLPGPDAARGRSGASRSRTSRR